MVATRRSSKRITKKAKVEDLPVEEKSLVIAEESTLKSVIDDDDNDFQDPVVVTQSRFMRSRNRSNTKRKAVIDDTGSSTSFLTEDKSEWSYAATPESSNSSISVDIKDRKGKGKEIVKDESDADEDMVDLIAVEDSAASDDELDFSAVANSTPQEAASPEFVNSPVVDQQEVENNSASSNNDSDDESSSEDEAPTTNRRRNARGRGRGRNANARAVAERGATRRLQYVRFQIRVFIFIY